ncbi:fungal-specific transcription factor domain-containing protein [Trichoderma asperelloides]|nr:fungal-specific transcription factor domain-containing protein [Trichoderma asperelloides]
MDWTLRDAGDRVDLNAFNYSSDHIPVDHTSHLLWSTYQNPFNVAQEPASKYKENGLQQEAWLLDPPELAEQSLDIPGLGGHRTDQSKAASYTQLRDLTDDDRDRIQQAAKACLEDPIWAPISFTAFPSKEKLDHCIDLFFVNFQPVLSFIHRPTFDPTVAPVTLILAIASIGARFTNLSGAASFANVIAKLNRRLLISMGEREPRIARSVSFMAAQLLQGIYGYCSGDRVLFNYSETTRWSLIQTGKQVGLFHDTPRRTPPAKSESVEAQWSSWIASERRKRLGWAIHEFDALASVLHNQRPAFSTADLTLALPSDADSWEAPSAHAWMALRPWKTEVDPVGFRLAARSCFDTSLVDSIQLTDTQHIHIIMVTLARFVWSLKELQVSPLMDVVPDYLPIPDHKATLTKRMADFLVSPHILRRSMTVDDRTFRHVTQRALIIHMSYLYGASDLMDWLPALLRSAGFNKPARERMVRWGEEDPARVRKVIYHSSQIMGICRDFPFNTPYESFYAFYAGAVLWCSATLLASPIGDSICDDKKENTDSVLESDRVILVLDKPPMNDVANWTANILKWVHGGGGYIQLGLFGVPMLGTPASRVQVLQETVRVLQNMRVWDISRAFASTLRRLMRAEEVIDG